MPIAAASRSWSRPRGRLDHIGKSVNLGQVEIFVLVGPIALTLFVFIPDIKRIMALLPATAKRQNLLFGGDLER
jgi:hypothetical protein